MRLRALVTLLLWSTSLFGADPVPAVPTPLLLPMQNMPAPIIIFNYGTYNGSVPTAAQPNLPAPAPAQGAPSLGVEALLPPRLTDDGLRLVLIGGTQGKGLNDYLVGGGLDIRFVEYLGMELRLQKGVSNEDENRTTEVFLGPKVQLPLKSSLVSFTPSLGAGFGIYEIGSYESSGLALFVRAELELGNFLVLSGKFETALAKNNLDYQYASYNDYYSPSSDIYSSISLRGGIRVSPRLVLSVEYAERGFGGERSPLATFQAEIKF